MFESLPIFAIYQRLGFVLSSGTLDYTFTTDKHGQKKGKKTPGFDGGSWFASEKYPKGGQFRDNRNMYALHTGSKSGCFGIDIDDPSLPEAKHLMSLLDDCCNMKQETRKGFHYLFKIDDKEIKTTANASLKIDVKAEGGFLFAEPTHYFIEKEIGEPSEKVEYKFIQYPFEDEELNTISDEAYEYCLSIKLWGDTVKAVKPKPVKEVSEDPEPEKAVSVISSEVSDEPSIIPELLDAIDKKHLENFTDWVKTGLVCFHEGQPLAVWDKASKRASNYDKQSVEKQWKTFKPATTKVSQGTLWFWVKQENPTKYHQLVKKRSDFFDVLFNLNHAGVADYFHQLKPNAYAYNADVGWYALNKHNTWDYYNKKTPNGLINDIHRTLTDLAQDHTPCLDMRSEDPLMKKKVKALLQFKQQIGNRSFCEGIVAFLPALYTQVDLLTKIDETRNVFAFSNGRCYDLEKCEYRDIQPQDWVSLTTGYESPEEVSEDDKKKVFGFVEKIWDSKDTATYILNTIALHLDGNGQSRFQRFHIWTGIGSNGKGVFRDMIQGAFGNYFHTFPNAVLTQAEKNKDQACSPLAQSKGKRLVFSSEPEASATLQAGFIKELTGDDEISTRNQYSSAIKFRPQFGLFLLANHVPKIKVDQGVKRRIDITPFPFKFVEEVKDKSHRLGNPLVKEQFVKPTNMRNATISLLIDLYAKWVKGGCKNILVEGDYTPRSKWVADASKEYIASNNPIEAWLSNNYEITDNKDDMIKASELYMTYKSDTKDDICNNEFARLMTFNEIKNKRLSKGVFYIYIKRLEEPKGSLFVED